MSNIRNFRGNLTHLLEGTLPETKSAARTNSFVYEELLNHSLSPGLLAYVQQRLRALMAINPEITMDPLRTRGHQYRISRPAPKTAPQAPCPGCHIAHRVRVMTPPADVALAHPRVTAAALIRPPHWASSLTA